MGIITLTTDLGAKDFYIPAVKGYILSNTPDAKIVDITHEIAPFNIAEASCILKGCYREFPADTLHLISVDSGNSQPKFIAVRTATGIFFGHDNGVISLVIEEETPIEVISLPFETGDSIFSLRKILAPAALKLLGGVPFSGLGTAVSSFMQKANLVPILEDNIVRGSVMHLDNFGNVITNIHRNAFERFARGRNFIIYVTSRDRVKKISAHYADVEQGEVACLFNTNGYLEVAINKGRACNLLGLKLNATIMIEFE
jgi:S-adenosylmethionine hydrolase